MGLKRLGFYFLTTVFTFSPATVYADTLIEAYEKAKENDPTFQAYVHEKNANSEIRKQSLASLLPSLDFTASKTERNQEIKSSDNTTFGEGETDFPVTNYAVTLTQSIYSYQNWARHAESKLEVERLDAEFISMQQDLIMRVATAYLDALNASENYQTAMAEVRSLEKHYEVVQVKRRDGLVRRTDLLDAEARYMQASSRKLEAFNQLRDALMALSEVTGENPETLNLMGETLPLVTPQPNTVEQWLETALEHNPALQMRQKAAKVAEKRIKVERGAHYPTLDLKLNYDDNEADGTLFGGGSHIVTEDVVISLNIPLYTGGATSSRVRAAVERQNQSRQELNRERIMVERDVKAAFDGIIGDILKVRAMQKSVEAYELGAEARRMSYKSGLVAVIAVLDAERDLYLARRELANARYSYIYNILRLKSAAGLLTEADLIQANALLTNEVSQTPYYETVDVSSMKE